MAVGGENTSGTSNHNVRIIVSVALLLLPVASCLNLGLIAGDFKKLSSPLVIKRVNKHAPIFINIKTGHKPPLSLPKLPPKPPPIKIRASKPSRKVPRSILPLPKLPLLPILPILPPILPPLLPILPKLPLLPLLPPWPLLPPLTILPKLNTLRPLQVPIIKRSPLKALDTKLKIDKLPPIKLDKKDGILDKLLDLKKKGLLTTAEFVKFKKLLLKK